jgi:hypothetical protein
MPHAARWLAFVISPGTDEAICSSSSSAHEFDAERLPTPPNDYALLALWVIGYKGKTETRGDAGSSIDDDLCATARDVRHEALAGRFLTIDRDPRRLVMA